MTTLDKSNPMSLVLNPKTASILSKVYWEIRNQRNELNSSDEDHTLIYFQDLILELESQIDSSLELFCRSSMTGKWAISNLGIGPVTATRLLSYIDIVKSRTPEHLWSYAGLVPNQTGKQKLTYNNNLKEVCIDLGKNFVKYSAKEECFYGQLANEALQSFSSKEKNFIKDKPIYELGKLPQERIDAQAQRYAVKIFLAHWHAVAHYEAFGIEYETHHKNIIPVFNSPF